jgi:hypothetical protein
MRTRASLRDKKSISLTAQFKTAVLAIRRISVLALDTGETLPMTAPDQVLVSGLLRSGTPVSIHYRGGEARGVGLVWEISGIASRN